MGFCGRSGTAAAERFARQPAEGSPQGGAKTPAKRRPYQRNGTAAERRPYLRDGFERFRLTRFDLKCCLGDFGRRESGQADFFGLMTQQMVLFIAVLLPLVTGIVIWLGGNRVVSRAWIPALPAVVVVLLTLVATGTVSDPGTPIPWAPAFGMSFNFSTDGLALFFAYVVSVVGVFVLFYAVNYFERPFLDASRFYGSMLLFMSAMLGTVLSSNMLVLFVFWEMTGLASFLLIGFSHDKEASRLGARMALLVTGATGLCLLAGFVLIAGAAGSWELSDWMEPEWRETTNPALLNTACALVFLGAMGKSAQFPFFFWLPNAMAAPTPVSAYLHSATMVKLGVFLSARMFPVLSDTEMWLPLVTGVGGATFVICTAIALFAHDLKAILAFSTVAQLGILISWYGIGVLTGVPLDKFHILNHVLYKGSFFMFVGIVDHCCHIRDVRRLGGLRKLSPWLAAGFVVAALGMAGLPGTTGFVSKELMLKPLEHLAGEGSFFGIYLLSCLLLGSFFKAAFSFRLIATVVGGTAPEEMRSHWHAPSRGLLAAPLVLVSGVVIFGLYPQALSGLFQHWMVPGLNAPTKDYLAPWYGFNLALALSLGVLALGFGLFALLGGRQWKLGEIPAFLRWDLAFDRGIEAWFKICAAVSRLLQAEREMAWPRLVMGFFVVLVGAMTFREDLFALIPSQQTIWEEWSGPRVMTSVLVAFAALMTVLAKRWTAQLIALSTVGFLATFYYVLYQAPDLAMTQVLVETATLLLLVFLLARFPKTAERGDQLDQGRSGFGVLCLSVAVGVVVTVLALTLSRPLAGTEAQIYLGQLLAEATKPLGAGQNAVNVVLVDFRGFDTLGEIIVLLIAVLGCVGVLMRRRASPSMSHKVKPVVAEPPSFIFRSLALVLFFIMNVFAIYLLLRGHYEPGGGFIGGLVSAMAFILVLLGMGPDALSKIQQADPLRLAVIGALIALASSALPLVWGGAFLEQYNAYVNLPLLGKTGLSTTLAFDTGVFLVVVGISVKALLLLVRNAAGLPVFSVNQQTQYSAKWEEPVEVYQESVASKGGES